MPSTILPSFVKSDQSVLGLSIDSHGRIIIINIAASSNNGAKPTNATKPSGKIRHGHNEAMHASDCVACPVESSSINATVS